MPEAAGRIVVRGGRVLAEGADPDQPAVADILIEGTTISRVAPDLGREGDGAVVVDARNKLVIPGLVNAHYHSHDLLLKGTTEELPLEIWALYARPQNYPPLAPEHVRARTLVGALECIRGGITTVQDMHALHPSSEEYLETVLDAYDEAGLRVVFAIQVADLAAADTVPYWRELVPADALAPVAGRAADPRAIVDFVERQLRRPRNARPRLAWALGPSGPQRCSPELLAMVADLANRAGLPVFTHLYETKAQAVQARLRYGEYGGSLVTLLERTGLLGPRLNCAHAIWLAPDEMRRLGEAGAGAVLNPNSNMKLKSGVPPVPELRAAGVRLALGCDNCSGSDVQSMFQAMKAFALLAGVSDPTPRPDWQAAREALRHATEGGARAVGMADRIGVLRAGMKADLAIVDLDDPVFVPLNSATRQLVYGEAGRGVETVIIDGRIVLRDRRSTCVDESALYEEVRTFMPRLREQFAAVRERNARLLPYLLKAHARAWQQDVGVHRFVGPAAGRF
jgi:guanine deaminase